MLDGLRMCFVKEVLTSVGFDIATSSKEHQVESEGRQKLHSVIQSCSMAVAVVDRDNAVVCANSPFNSLINNADGTEVELRVSDIFIGRSLVEFEINCAKLWSEKSLSKYLPCFRCELIRRDGYTVSVDVSLGVVSYEGQAICLVAVTPSMPEGYPVDLMHSEDEIDQVDVGVLAGRRGQVIPGSFRYDVLEDRISWSDEVFAIAGRKHHRGEPSLEEFLSQVVHPGDRARVERLIRGSIADKKPFSMEHRALTVDGELKYVQCVSWPLIDEKGEATVLFGTVIDISEQHASLELLREREQKYRTAFENAQIGLYRTRISDGKLMLANEQMAHMFGYEGIEDALANYVTSEHYVDPNTREELLDRLRREGRFDNFEARLSRRDGSVGWYRYSGKIYPEKGYIEGIAVDITFEKQARELLQQSESKYQRMFDLSPEAIVLIDAQARIVELNNRFEEWLGYSREETLGQNIVDLPFLPTPSKAIVSLNYQDRMKGQVIPPYEIDMIARDGTRLVGQIIATSIKDESGAVVGDLVMVADVSERRQAQETLELQRRQLMSMFDAMDEVVYVADPDTYELLYLNTAAKNQWGDARRHEVLQGPAEP